MEPNAASFVVISIGKQTGTLGFPNSKKNSFRGNNMRIYGNSKINFLPKGDSS